VIPRQSSKAEPIVGGNPLSGRSKFPSREGSSMFCGMASGTPRKGKEDALRAAAEEHAAALLRQPGCVAAYVLRERGTRAQVSLSVFRTEDDFNRAMDATMPIIAKHHLDELREGSSTFRLFDVLGGSR
jgi:heme-degrading monooxygenase HmoA